MDKPKGFFPLLIPSATVFFSSACIMTLELVAGRLIARHLGSSLYTWTSVIGIVLLGITIGNYLGGRLADRFNARKALAILLGISSIACVVTVVLNNTVGEWIWLWKLNWPTHVFTHVFLAFMLPSTLLGTISPVVAKMALDKGLPTGRTVGDIYAWGAAGSIVGTFLTGFFLIAAMGTVAIIWTVAAALLLMAIIYWARFWVLYIWAAIFIALMTMAMAPIDWAKQTSSNLALREKTNPNIIYEDESQYSYIAIKRTSETVDQRAFMLDKLTHSQIIMNNILDLQYFYERIYAAATHLLSRGKDKLSVFAIGGGGYVIPRYIEKVWPGSRIDVAEIDPRVTEAAIQAFGLEKNIPINIFTMDARKYVDQLLEKKRTGGQIPRYDFIYEDAFNDYSIPYQLTTREFNDKIAQILTDDGVYMVNAIDTSDSGLFLGTIIKTLKQTFSHIYVIADNESRSLPRGTFVIIAAMHQINIENITQEKLVANSTLWFFNESEIETYIQKARGIVLTDDYTPVENMLAPVIRQRATSFLLNKYQEQIKELANQGKLDEIIEIHKEIIKADLTKSIIPYNYMVQLLARQGKWQEVIDNAKTAIEYNDRAKVKSSTADMNYYISFASKKLGKNIESSEYIEKAILEYREDLAKNPDTTRILIGLGNALAEVSRFSEATPYFLKAIDINPLEPESHFMLVGALLAQQRYDEAIADLKKAIESFSNTGNEPVVAELQRYLQFIEDKNKNK
jgi:spermidine synthase